MTEEVHFIVAKKNVSIRFDAVDYNKVIPYIQSLGEEPFEVFKITTENVSNEEQFKKKEVEKTE